MKRLQHTVSVKSLQILVFVLGFGCAATRPSPGTAVRPQGSTGGDQTGDQAGDHTGGAAAAVESVEPTDAGATEPGTVAIDRSGLTDVGMDAPLDYADPAMWACRPGNRPSPCDTDLDATAIAKDASREVVRHAASKSPAIDCFYVYPTVKLSGEGNLTDFSDTGIALINDPLQSQAARFNRLCRVYAPLYRQIGLVRTKEGLKPAPGADRELAVADVRAAFAYYLEQLNQGRRFVLMGHSQGTTMLTAMMQEDVDPVPDVRARMLSALLLGGRVSVAKGKTLGGSFQHIPTCSAPGQTGCVVAFVSHAAEAPPPKGSRFGASTEPGTEIACTEPAALAGRAGPLSGSYVRATVHNPLFLPDQPLPEGIETPFVLYRDALQGRCVKRDGYSYLEISRVDDPADQRGELPYRSQRLEAAGFGLHIVDYNLALEDLLKAVELQAAQVR